jgi:ketosteroid isomerase-like protein
MKEGWDETSVVDEIRSAFDGYEAALQANDVAALTGCFWQDPRVVRLTSEGGAYGIGEIEAFRNARDPRDLAREITRVEIVALSRDIGVATAEYRRLGSGRRGGQSQVWMRTQAGWRIASAHVSLGP